MIRFLFCFFAIPVCSFGFNITNYPATNHADVGHLLLLSDVGRATNFNISVSNLSGQIQLGGRDLLATNTVTATNGFVLIQAVSIPTNSVPPSSASVTNWLLLVNTNGLPSLVATNYSDSPAGQAFFIKPLWP